ncbi:MAG: MaoC family dehydratase [Halobacteriaceae archaeon]
MYFEDLNVGSKQTLGTVSVSKEEIISFAEKYDPQPFHIDEKAASDSPYGSVIASGWHTAALCMRILVDEFLSDIYAQGALGVDELRWPHPVRPGDTLTVKNEIVKKRPSESDSSRGIVHSKTTAVNQESKQVLSWIGLVLVRRRNA